MNYMNLLYFLTYIHSTIQFILHFQIFCFTKAKKNHINNMEIAYFHIDIVLLGVVNTVR